MKSLTVLQGRRLLLASGLACLLPAQARGHVLHVAAADFPPWSGPTLAHGGVLSQIVRLALQTQGLGLQLHFLPWARALSEVQSGLFDALLALPPRENDAALAYSLPIANMQPGFFKQQSRQFNWQELSELKYFKIGIVRGYPLPPALAGLQLNTFDSLDDATSLRKLALGRLDLALVEKHTGHWLIARRLADSRIPLDWHAAPLEQQAQHLAFSRKRAGHQQFLQAFNLGMQKIQDNGRLGALLRQAGLAL
ncbi:transporter substrate-binding domain-containing protein [Massilia sp. W12]|uniref:substrate-binding periplasmic protein n=1 Tax=Massilia sp. W12 TaxID=3126507 RepID=UPI0030CD4330